jgi:NhaP-type Na+/H+ or K+/H+ antiporter
MEVFIAILVLIAAGVLATTRRAYRIRRTRPVAVFVAGGWLSVLTGMLLGPGVLGLIDREAIFQTVPLLAIGLGWIGLLIGFQLRISLLRSLPRTVYVLALIDGAASALGAGIIAACFIGWWVPEPSALVLALPVVFVVASTMGWSVETRSLGIAFDERVVLLIRASGALAGVGAVLFFGVASKAIGTDASGLTVFLPERAGIKLVHGVALALAIGAIGRFMLTLASSSRGNQFAVFLGIVAFVSGAAKQLDVSPLITAMIAGAVITNMKSPDLREFESFIMRAEHTFAILFGLLAGLLLQPVWAPELLLAACAVVTLRLIVKPMLFRVIAPRFLGRHPATKDQPPTTLANHLAVARQSPLMLALGVSLILLEPSSFNKHLLWMMVLVGVLAEFPASIGALIARGRGRTPGQLPAPGTVS